MEGKGFVKAKDLTKEDKLVQSDGSLLGIDSIQIEVLKTPETKYNFEVEDYHTYYVTESDILVHNDCGKVVKKPYEARVNTTNEHGFPHAHILKDGKRIAKIDVEGKIVKGSLDQGGKRFVKKFLNEIVEIIKRYYPKK